MIIFGLDNVLANCEHRRHLVDPSKRNDCYYHNLSNLNQMEGWYLSDDISYPDSRVKFQPDWQAYFEACDKDEPILTTIDLYKILEEYKEIEIWSGRCETTRKSTEKWLDKYEFDLINCPLKMRPIGNTEPAHVLKERWLNEQCKDLYCCKMDGMLPVDHSIEMVFDADPESIAMWKRRGVFVFDCRQE